MKADVEFEELSLDLQLEKLGIWIDPIDATAEYIGKGITKDTRFPRIPAAGLQCVTVLIGVHDLENGVPIMGVINQPFAEQLEDGLYKSKLYYGVAAGDTRVTNVGERSEPRTAKIALLSSSEQTKFTKFLKQKLRYEIVYSAGAGHKILKCITDEADMNLVSRGTTFKVNLYMIFFSDN